MPETTLATGTADLFLDEGGILRGKIRDGAEETIEDAKVNVKMASELAQGAMVPVLIDLRGLKSITREARSYYAGENPAKYSIAQALLVGSAVSKLIGNFFIGLNKTPFPTRLFTSEQEAVDWLKGFLK